MAPKRTIPQGTFVVLAIIGVGLIAMAGYAVYGMVQIALHSIGVGDIDHGPVDASSDNPAGIGALSIIAIELIRNVIKFGDRVFRWTRDIEESKDEEELT